MRKAFLNIHAGLSVLALALAVVQFFLAGIGAFGASNYMLHMVNGYLIGLVSVLLAVIALATRVGGLRLRLSLALPLLLVLQIVLASLPPVVAALHAVNAIAILGVSGTLMRASLSERAASRTPAQPSQVEIG